jgi:hypothetical protein
VVEWAAADNVISPREHLISSTSFRFNAETRDRNQQVILPFPGDFSILDNARLPGNPTELQGTSTRGRSSGRVAEILL